MANTNAEVAERRKMYDQFWKGNKTPASDAALELFIQMSRESMEGFEGADYITVAPILSSALSTAESNLAQKVLTVLTEDCYDTGSSDYYASEVRNLFTRLNVKID